MLATRSSPIPTRAHRSKRDAARDIAFQVRLLPHMGLRAKHRHLVHAQLEELGGALVQDYFEDDQAYLSSPQGAKDFFDHLTGRLADNRRRMIPWLNGIRPLAGMRILEIGAGTGSSAVALAEQGALLTGIDIESRSLAIARKRCDLYGLGEVDFQHANISDQHRVFEQRYDLIVFFASLEHMTFEERIEGLRKTWAMLSPGGLLAVVECPNRLWFFDDHTAQLPYFHWLPDALALAYAIKSPRPSLRDAAPTLDMNAFLRRGRGASFHEFELALGSLESLHVAGELESFLQRCYPAFYLKHRLSIGRQYEALLQRISPKVHKGFLRQSLDIVLQRK